ncbi:hypothetical protein ANCDUO_17245 [Ancylostoma duodenale]|uniref:SCP domain-containing protein n=1 Tax=Ancylostoma duodenale TaxID=51022 RepID=A0A0C2G6E9_9BILA|nr:hypothetical protein ANCDUO_17245 [Ancylostoma duodenale]
MHHCVVELYQLKNENGTNGDRSCVRQASVKLKQDKREGGVVNPHSAVFSLGNVASCTANDFGPLAVLLRRDELSRSGGCLMPIPDFGCKNTLISDEWRKYVLITHNKMRRNLAIGQVKTANGAKMAPMAFNMNELIWDCDVEKYASDNMCSASILNGYYAITQTFKNTKDCNVTEETSKLLKEWWSESNAVDLVAENAVYTDPVKQKASNFAHMAFALVKGFACTYGTCAGSTGLKLYCVYRRKE